MRGHKLQNRDTHNADAAKGETIGRATPTAAMNTRTSPRIVVILFPDQGCGGQGQFWASPRFSVAKGYSREGHCPIPSVPLILRTLFYFMRCMGLRWNMVGNAAPNRLS